MVQRSSLLLPCALPKVTMEVYSVFFTTITIEYKIFSDLEPFFLAHTRNLHPLSRLKMSSQPSPSCLLDLPRELRDMIPAPSPTASNTFVVSYTTKPKA